MLEVIIVLGVVALMLGTFTVVGINIFLEKLHGKD